MPVAPEGLIDRASMRLTPYRSAIRGARGDCSYGSAIRRWSWSSQGRVHIVGTVRWVMPGEPRNLIRPQGGKHSVREGRPRGGGTLDLPDDCPGSLEQELGVGHGLGLGEDRPDLTGPQVELPHGAPLPSLHFVSRPSFGDEQWLVG